MLDFFGELVLELLGAAIPPRLGTALFVLLLFAAAAGCFGFGGWILYRVFTDPAERPFLYLTGIAWGVGGVLALMGWIVFKRRER